MRLISVTSLPIFVVTIFLLFVPKCNGKSRPSIYQYRRFSASSYPTPWRSYGGGAGGVLGGIGGEHGDLGISYRSSRKVAGIQDLLPRQQQQLPSYKVGLDGLRTPREINYWSSSSYSSKPSYYSSCEYSCDDGTCLKKEYKCDGYAQCWDGSDEKDCSCSQIIAEDKICDGYKDCPDGQDEKDCVYGCQSTEFTCDTYNSGSRVKCISMSKRCDGYSDCPLGNDEHNCFRLVDLYDEEQRGVMSKGILQKRLGDNEWHTVCKTSSAASYITQFAEKACEQIIGKVDGTIRVTTEILSQQKQQMTKQQIQQLKYLRLAEIEAKFAVLGKCASDLVYLVECPKPQCGGHGNYYNYEKEDRRRRRRDVEDLDELFEGEEFDEFDESDEEVDQTELIVGGYNTEEMKWPFLVGILRDGEFYCGGSIINEYWIMTAAHCCHGYENHVFEVQAGMTRRLSWSPYEQSRMVTEIHVHEEYNSRIFANDIALFKLDKPLHLSKYVTPACLPSGPEDDPVGGMECKVAGWGDLMESGGGPDHMQEVGLPILSKCQETFTRDPYQICAGYTEGGKDACQGDSGGPLLCWNSIGKPIVNGVVSFGRGCARANEAGVYTKVSSYVTWLQSVISEVSSSYNLYPSKLPKQCSEKCYKPGGECIFPGDKCQGTVDCLGAEDELGCTHLVTRAHENPPPYNSPYYAKPPTSYHTSPQFGMQRSGVGGSSYSQPLPAVSYYPYVPSVLPFLPPPPPPQTNFPPFAYPFIMQRAIARETRKVDCAPSEFKCSGRSVEQSSTVQCMQETQRCDRIFDCTDKSDELECATLTSNFRGQMSPSSLTELNEVKGYVLTRYQGTQWLPLVSNTWTLAMGQEMCNKLTNSDSKLMSLETIKVQELSDVLHKQTGANLMSGQAVKLDLGETAKSQGILTTDSEKILGHANQLSKINLEKDTGVNLNNNDKSNEMGNLMVAFVKCQK